MSTITTHVLDTSCGRPARNVPVVLDLREGENWQTLGRGTTDADGRLRNLLSAKHTLVAGVYRLSFDVGTYFGALKIDCFYPTVEIIFKVREPLQSYHVPLLISPFGYSTYRGS